MSLSRVVIRMMESGSRIWLAGIILLALFGAVWIFYHSNITHMNRAEEPRVEPFWVTAYLASWQHNAGTAHSNWGHMTVDDLDWEAFTHLIYFALPAGPDGRPGYSLQPESRNNLNFDRITSIVAAAESAGKPVLISVGGAGNYDGFSSAIQPENRQQFLKTLVEMVEVHGFDGVDLDMEPIRRTDYRNFRDLVEELHEQFSERQTRRGSRPLITIAALKGVRISGLYASVQQYVDQINIMTYDMAQPWSGWQAWHNSALFGDGVRFQRRRRAVSSVDQKVEEAIRGGIDPLKIGIGIDFYGYIWKGVHLMEKWDGWPAEDMSILERFGGVPYEELDRRFDLDDAVWDERAEVSYLNIEHPRLFISFDNEQAVRRKVRYAAEERLGGVMLWELGGGFLTDTSTGSRSPLLKAVKQEVEELKEIINQQEFYNEIEMDK